MRIWWGILFGLLLACRGSAPPPVVSHTPQPSPAQPTSQPVGLLKSGPTFEALGWRAEWEWQGARKALEALGLQYEVVTPAQLDQWNGQVLVLPNVRNMAPETVQAITAQTQRGARLLATYMTSYKRHDSGSWSPNNFALAQALGVDFHRWVGSGPLATEVNYQDRTVALGRGQAMLVTTHPGAEVLATWTDGSPAIVQGPSGIYVGEDLFCNENSASEEILALLAELFQRLDLELGSPPLETAFLPPKPPFVPVKASGIAVTIDLGQAEPGLVFRTGQQERVALDQPLRLTGEPYLEVLRPQPNGTYSWSAYRGEVAYLPGVGLRNTLDLEEYLAGVVPSEVPADFPGETLKSMAVVARTFTLSHRGRHGSADLCAEVHCQVYRGLAKEARSTSQAISDTSGLTLSYRGRPADTTFHAVCGGYGADASKVWRGGSRESYLSGQPDTDALAEPLDNEEHLRAFLTEPPPCFCQQSGRFRWRETYTWEKAREKLAEGLAQTLGPDFHGLEKLRSVAVASRTASGRVAVLEVHSGLHRYQAEGDAVRWLFSGGQIGAGGLNSTLFLVQSEPGQQLTLVGGGWGHGVGLCQEGAAGRARAGQDFTQILEHYYPGTVMK